MTQVVITLDPINCIHEKDHPSTPYLWTALVSIDETTAEVSVLTPNEDDDRVVLASNLQAGQSAQIPAAVGVATQPAAPVKAAFIEVVVLWQKHGTPGSVVRAGFNAFGESLQSAITQNLLGLASTDPATQQQAIDKVQTAVSAAVYKAIDHKLSDWEKAEIALGLLTLDAQVATGQQVVRDIQSQSFTISLGEPYDGRLLFYFYGNQDGTGSVAGPSVIGDSGWDAFKFVFSAGDGIIYAVNHDGNLLFYRDHNQDGTGNVANPTVIGHGGWTQFDFLFSGGNGIIYAVNHQGQLLFYRDHNQDGTGNVADPSVIGDGGWADFKFLFGGGNGIIYAVNSQGQLLFYRDHNQDGTGNVANPTVIGASGFDVYKFLFSGGGKGIIYAAEEPLTHYYTIPMAFQVAGQ